MKIKNTQEPQQAPAQQQKHPSVLLMEVQEALTQQQQPLNAILSIVSDLAEEVRDLKSLVQTLRVHQANPMVQPYEDGDPKYDEPVDDQEYSEDADEENFQDDQAQAYEEEGDEALSSIQEPEPVPQRRRAAQPAEPTCEGPKPFLLPDVPRARLNVRRQEGGR